MNIIIKVLVVDNDNEAVNRIKKYFNGSKNNKIEIVDYIIDGKEAINKLKDIEYDILVLDLIMPNKDGFSILDYIKENNIEHPTIVSGSINNFETISKLSEYNIKYYALKPYDVEDMVNNIINLYECDKNNKKLTEIYDKDIQIQVTNILHSLGIPSHIKGYQLIRSAILLVYDNPGFIGGITKDLYPDLASKFKTSTQRVERAIRHAIEVAWIRGDIDLMEEIFGHSVDIDRAKPTNSEFIVTIADKLRLDMINV